MKGKNKFTQSEIDQIKILIREKNRAIDKKDKSNAKASRDRMRDIGFYITDFSDDKNRFNVDDFENLIIAGLITIIES